MDPWLSVLKCDAPENRVLEWLKHCSAAPKDVEHSSVASKCTANEIYESDFISSIHKKNHLGALRVQCSSSRQKNSFSTTRDERSKAKRQKSSETDSGCLSSSTALRLYSHEENLLIIRYIVENDAFPFLKGTLLWKKMEKDKICYRSWQSMKAQFITKIYPNISEYALEHTDKEKFIEYMKPSPHKKIIHMEPGQRGWRKNGKYYTIEEDLLILKYILRRRRHLEVHGNSMWQTMEDKQILPGRTWQSMRSRYLNVIRHSLDEYKSKACGIEILMKSKKNGSKKKLYMDLSPPLSPCTNITNTICRKATNQDIRKYAISASAQLASKLKLLGEKVQNERNSDKEKQDANCSSAHHVSPDIETPAFDKPNTSERNTKNNNDVNRKNVKCSITDKVSSIELNSLKDDVASAHVSMNKSDSAVASVHVSKNKSDNAVASADVSMDKSDSATQILVEDDMSIRNSGSGNNLQECDLISAVTQSKTLEGTQTFVKNHSSLGNSANSNEDRNNVESEISSLVCNLQETVDSVNQNSDGLNTTACTEKHSCAEVNVMDVETLSEISDCEASFCSRETVTANSPKEGPYVCIAINNCIKCSSENKLSPSSN